MSINKMSSDGVAEDLIRSFVQFGCSELHAKSLADKAKALSENTESDEEQAELLAEVLAYEELTDQYADLRRGVMTSLNALYPDGNKDVWCLVKHLGMASYTLFEGLQACTGEQGLEELETQLSYLYTDAHKAFVRVLSMWLGTEVTDCSACLGDMLKARLDKEDK